MKWANKKYIFNPVDYKLPNDCIEYAQSPQTLLFDNYVRVYFSTRAKDKLNNKYLSHIAYVDFDKTFSQVLNISSNTVIPLGELGTFDEHGIFPINILKYNNQIFAYTCGWSRRIAVSVETSIGLAISRDNGDTFIRVGDGPALTSSAKEPVLVGDPFVIIYNGVFHMWYIFGQRWLQTTESEQPERIYKIGHATSSDGVSWHKEEGIPIINDTIGEEECQALPSVVHFNGKFHMYFCYRYATDFRKNPERGYKLGYAYSYDLIHWHRADDEAGIINSKDEWDSEMMCYPHVFVCDEKLYLMYNGNQFGRYGFGIVELEP